MAGLGRKVFTSGDILLASEVQGFLQDQSVMVFDDDAARGSAIPTPTEGMVTFRKDDNTLEVFDGSVFAPVGSPSGLVHINTSTFSAVSSHSVNDVFSASFDTYKVFVRIESASANASLNMRYRVSGSDSTVSYSNAMFFLQSGTGTGTVQQDTNIGFNPLGDYGTSNKTLSEITIFNVFEASQTTSAYQTSMALSTVARSFVGGAKHAVTSSFTGMTIFPSAGNFTGLITIFGVKK